jgi:cysteine desulfurase/selenocysteine lyase
MDILELRSHYPMLSRLINGHPLIYFDNSATALKPDVMLNALQQFYLFYDSNVYRGWHVPSAQATHLYEESRRIIASFLGTTANNIVFITNTTDGMVKIASTLKIKKVLLCLDLHHSSMLPFREKFKYKFVKLKEDGSVDLSDLRSKIKDADAVITNHASNVTGVIQDVEQIGEMCHRYDKLCIVDGAQSVPHIPYNVEKMPIDALVFSGHKIGGPYGSGAMYISKRMQAKMKPIGGGESIKNVVYDGKDLKITYADFPHCLEAGTPSIANQIALAQVIDFLKDKIQDALKHEREVIKPIYDLYKEKNIRFLGPDLDNRGGLIASALLPCFSLKLATWGICSRYGYHCAEPLHHFLKSPPTLRFSVYVYNTIEEGYQVAEALSSLLKGEPPNIDTLVYPEPSITPVQIAFNPCRNCHLCDNLSTQAKDVLMKCPFIPFYIKNKYFTRFQRKLVERAKSKALEYSKKVVENEAQAVEKKG